MAAAQPLAGYRKRQHVGFRWVDRAFRRRQPSLRGGDYLPKLVPVRGSFTLRGPGSSGPVRSFGPARSIAIKQLGRSRQPPAGHGLPWSAMPRHRRAHLDARDVHTAFHQLADQREVSRRQGGQRDHDAGSPDRPVPVPAGPAFGAAVVRGPDRCARRAQWAVARRRRAWHRLPISPRATWPRHAARCDPVMTVRWLRAGLVGRAGRIAELPNSAACFGHLIDAHLRHR